MKTGKRPIRAIAIAALVVVLVATLLYSVGPTTSNPATGKLDTFTLGAAIAVAGYFAFPALLLLGSGLLLVALLLLVAHAIERRRTGL